MTYTVELTTWPGLLPALGDELAMRQLGYTIIDQSVQLVMRNPWNLAPRIYCAQAAFLCLSFAVPRPKALLGQQYWDQIVALGQQITAENEFATLELAAAGAESAVMKRIATTLAERLKLRVVPSEGDLQVRIRPSPTGWDVLLRLTPRPLGTRAWRVSNYPGALNAAVAASMVRLAGVYADDTILNLACGSGTLLIERLRLGAAQQAWGCDTSLVALDSARANMIAANVMDLATIHDWDATSVPLADGSIDLIMADLPFGQLIGTHANNLTLYPAIIREAARLLSPRGRMVLVSHEIRLLQDSVHDVPGLTIGDQFQVRVGGMSPVVMLVQRSE